ncbi:MAG: hypothetical protein IKW27_06320 [Bacteroidales bacterium]|nr:hypothetical protein [Bacteroidales bacterium]
MERNVFETLGEGIYETPSVSVVELDLEGVLCASGITEEWEEGVLPED